MKKKTPASAVTSTPIWEGLEHSARARIQETIQVVLEEEITALLGRRRSERWAVVDAVPGYRNGFPKPRRLTLWCGTVEVRRPRVRGIEDRFESRVLPLFRGQTREVGDL